MHRTIAKENTSLGTKFQLMRVVFAKTRPARAAKNAEKRIVWLNLKKTEQWCFLIDNRCRHTINKISCREESLIPIAKWKKESLIPIAKWKR
jgi:hypothetical protein